MGKSWPKKQIDHEALRIWNGSGKNYKIASTTACQCVFESHFTFKNKPIHYRGHVGMRNKTILAEGKRIKLISQKKKDGEWLLNLCLKDPSLADQLAASRFVFLLKICKSEKMTLFGWVKGNEWKKSEVDLKISQKYYSGVINLRKLSFGI